MSTAPKPQPVSADPVKVDAKHYTIVAENDRVRVVRARYGPREKSVMHGHPSLVAVFLTSTTGDLLSRMDGPKSAVGKHGKA